MGLSQASTASTRTTIPVRQYVARFKGEAINLCRLLARYPSTVLYPFIVLLVVIGVGVWGINRVAAGDIDSSKSRASALAIEVASSFRQQLSVAASPLHSLAALVHHNPAYAFLDAVFASFAADLAGQVAGGSVRSLQLSPLGVVRLVQPLAGNTAALGLDLFAVTSERDGAVKTVADRVLTLVGPMAFKHGGFGVRVRLPIFVNLTDATTVTATAVNAMATVNVTAANGTTALLPAQPPFGGPDALNLYCGAPCATNGTTGETFWGFATALIDLAALASSSDSRLTELVAAGYAYRLSAPEAAEELRVISSSGGGGGGGGELPGRNPVSAPISLPNNEWLLEVAPRSGSWTPAWYAPLLAGVVLLGVALAAVLFAALVSRRQHQTLLEALLPRELIRDLVSRDAASMGPRILQADTPSDVLLKLLGCLLSGDPPDLRDVLLLRTAVVRHADFYSPLNLTGHIRDANLDADVARALMRQLGGVPDAENPLYEDLADGSGLHARFGGAAAPGDGAAAADGAGGDGGGGGGDADYDTLAGALALILTPQPAAWYDNGFDVAGGGGSGAADADSVAAYDAVPPAAGAECSFPSPMLSAFGAASLTGGAGGGGSIGSGGTATAAILLTQQHSLLRSRQQSLNNSYARERLSSRRASRDHFSLTLTSSAPMAPAVPPHMSASGMAAPAGAGGAGSGNVTAAGAAAPANLFLLQGRSSVPAVFSASAYVSGAGGGSCVGGGSGGDDGGGGGHLTPIASGEIALDLGQVALGNPLQEDRPSSRFFGTATNGGTNGPAAASGGNMLVAAVAAKARRHSMTPPPPAVIEEVERLLAGADRWQFDTWALQEASGGHALSCLGFFLTQRSGLLARFRINPVTMARLLRHIEAGYSPANPYHNSVHAADVLQTLHVILHGGQLTSHYLDQLGLLAAYFAAIIHDYGHPGVTNDFLIATCDPLALRYNDRSPLENHHAAAALCALRRPELDITGGLTAPERAAFRKLVIELVLATDMKQHFAVLGHFSTVHRLAAFAADKAPGAAAAAAGAPAGAPAGAAPERGGGAGSPASQLARRSISHGGSSLEPGAVSTAHPASGEGAPKPADEAERLLGLQVAIKAADLGHLGEELAVHKRWLAGLEEEFFRQGDRERALGLPISPLFDRAKQGVSKSQVGFYDFVALPLAHALCGAFPGCGPLMRCFVANYNHWRSVEAAQTPPTPSSSTSGGGTSVAAGGGADSGNGSAVSFRAAAAEP